MHFSSVQRWFDRIYIGLFTLLIFGTPLLFHTVTNSVFEVNKLLLLRLFTLLVLFIALVQRLLYRANGTGLPAQRFLGISWRPIGLEYPLLAWLGVNILSSIFSDHPILSIFGAYDRWEGLITIFNYVVLIVIVAKLLRERWQLNWCIGALLLSTSIAGIYGVFQSFGYDLVTTSWSSDPTLRVFASINNPVHYSAYVGMMVPLAVGALFYWEDILVSTRARWIGIWGTLIATNLIFYNLILSYSRASWLGFSAAISLLYLGIFWYRSRYASESSDLSARDLGIQLILDLIGIGAFYLIFVFRVQDIHRMMIFLPLFIVLFYVMNSYSRAIRYWAQPVNKIIDLLWILTFVLILEFSLFIPFSRIGLEWLEVSFGFGGALLLLIYTWRLPDHLRPVLGKFLVIVAFAVLIFASTSWHHFAFYLACIAGFYLCLRDHAEDDYSVRLGVGIMLSFGLLVALPVALQSHLQSGGSTRQVSHMQHRVGTLHEVAVKGTARSSMWKSAFPWVRDNLLLGTGPDTIKAIFPQYRRADYGRLEGGHHFTPDRLHNEYLNTLATRGVLGFLIYYVGVLGLWFWLVIKKMQQSVRSPGYFALTLSVGTAVLSYLGQVMFNFGVVATLVLFYILMGLGLSLVNSENGAES